LRSFVFGAFVADMNEDREFVTQVGNVDSALFRP